MVRKGLKIKPDESDQALLIKLRVDGPVSIEALVNGKFLGPVERVPADKQFQVIRIPLADGTNWEGVIKSMEIKLEGLGGTELEIDLIEVKRA